MSGLHAISGINHATRSGDVVFVHGLDGDVQATWHPKGKPSDFWPSWLGTSCPEIGVWSVAYDAKSIRWKGHAMPLDERATATLAALDAYGIGDRPIVFIAHSLGGLLVKQLLHNAWESECHKWKRIVEMTQGVIFLATPHSGSDLAGWFKYVGAVLKTNVVIDDLRSHEPHLRRLNTWYRNKACSLGIETEVYYEKQPTFGFMVVDETSANPGIPGVEPIPVDADHATICKPLSQESVLYLRTTRFVRERLSRPLRKALQEAAKGDETIEETRAFALPIKTHMATLRRRVETLTEEQMMVIRRLRGRRQVRISGCAGSGKTLIAAEKAIRLADAGLTTLFLCHSPLLARHIAELTKGTGVVVAAFCEWVSDMAGTPDELQRRWTTFEEPSDDCIVEAIAELGRAGEKFDAVIVDEGQDFRPEWWTVVQAALNEREASILYIFHDDNQSMLTHRARYPIQECLIDLSRNCRNAGLVYDLLRLVHPEVPAADHELQALGSRYLRTFSREDSENEICKAIRWLINVGCEEGPIVLLTSRTPFEQSPFGKLVVETSEPCHWQRELRLAFTRVANDRRYRCDKERVLEHLNGLSGKSFPDERDVKLVQDACQFFSVSPEIRRGASERHRRGLLAWKLQDGRARLWRRLAGPVNASDILLFFEQDNWLKGIPLPDMRRFHDALSAPTGNSIPVHHVSEYKGLEADVVLFFADGPSAITKPVAYVGISRARVAIALLVDRQIASSVPYALRNLVIRGADSTNEHAK